MSDLLSIGSTSVRAYQTALNVVGENIANANTTGYVRRNAQLTEISGGAGRYILMSNLSVGSGVAANTVSRDWDAFRAADLRNATAESGRTGSTIVWLERVENTLNTAGISAAMTKFFNAGQAIAADPTGSAPRAGFLDAAYGVSSAFSTTSNGLAAIDGDLRASAKLAVDQLNGLAAGLAEANAGLIKARDGSNEQAQLMDQRDRLVDQMSQLASISVTTDERGVATVKFNDVNGPTIVAGVASKSLDIAFNASGTMALTLDPNGTPEAVPLKGGSIAGFAEAATRISDLRLQVTNLATSFANGVNQVQAAGVDLDGQPGAALFDASSGDGKIAVNTLSGRQIAAARPWTVGAAAGNAGAGTLQIQTNGTPLSSTRISVSGGVLTATDPVTNSVIGTAPYTPGTPVTLAGLDITVGGAPADGDSFTVSATTPGSRDNGNLDLLSQLRKDGGFEATSNEMVSSNASALSAKRQVADAQNAILEGATAARDAVTGVNLDQEAVDLMRFQQAYQASSRIIQVSRDIFQSILDAVN
ncbi:flagellar hook-associated protein FlgK [Sphingomonas changbaiensis NBRC 104936]|uniref:Flagellar hook-associated protein 1 n=1 Tax=Sphingomonas changbaiensis NBRC 104936 TaxID=1219043 RepID=A0A0E9MQM2_9SPHN|nr:flagellar basal body rod C-terminal domain-containing protein [Sphingomonas changbaiensis]GAO39793.1 flagellar hook-associated protein FlgK [Sphingomonas changbaiensis NBRC 104936]